MSVLAEKTLVMDTFRRASYPSRGVKILRERFFGEITAGYTHPQSRSLHVSKFFRDISTALVWFTAFSMSSL